MQTLNPSKKNAQSQIARRLQRGISVVQIAVTVLVGAILLLGGLAAFRYVTQASINNDAQDIHAALTKLMELKSISPNDLNSTNLAAAAGAAAWPEVAGLVDVNRGRFTTSGRPIAFNAPAAADGTAWVIAGTAANGYTAEECRDLVNKLSIARTIQVGTAAALAPTGANLNTLRGQCAAAGSNIITATI